jgi:hypothetical protein
MVERRGEERRGEEGMDVGRMDVRRGGDGREEGSGTVCRFVLLLYEVV